MRLRSGQPWLIGVIMAILVNFAAAAPQFFTNQSAFNAAIIGLSFTTNLSFTAEGSIESPATFHGSGMSVQALSTNTNTYNLYSFGNNYLTINQENVGPLFFTNFSSAVTALGGLFFNLSNEGSFVTNNLVFDVLFADSSSLLTNVPSTSTNSFFGFIGDTSLASVSISTQEGTVTGGLPAASQLTLAVPEPSAIALLLLSSVTLTIYAALRRSRANM